MLTVHRDLPCHPGNYRRGRTGRVKYLVIHYVGATGDAGANARYYGGTPGIGASAHYFVGHAPDAEVWASVPEGDTAWHCGRSDGKYRHPACRNANSIGVELCCHQRADGTWYFDPETVDKAVELCRDIMGRYGIPVERVVRHYDVTGKVCPAPFVKDTGAWEGFKGRLRRDDTPPSSAPSGHLEVNCPEGAREATLGCPPLWGEGLGDEKGEEGMRLYRYVVEMPEWARQAAAKAINAGYIRMDETGAVGVWECNLQPLVWLDRAGVFDRPAGT